MSIEPTQADMAYAKSIVEAVEHGCTYEDRCLAVRDLLARHRLASTPASGEVVAWMYERNGKVRISHGERSEDMLPAWTETPLYAAPAQPAADLVEALKRAEQWFRDYERSHRFKGTADGNMKADTNQERADYLRAALSRYAGGA